MRPSAAREYFSEPAPAGASRRGGVLDPVAVWAPSAHSGISFTFAVVIGSRKAPFSASQANFSTGMATRWPPMPRNPPEVTTSRSICFESGFISTLET
jgi:hypothetical protein